MPGRLGKTERPRSAPRSASGTGPLNTLKGSDSRLPPKTEEGANARTEALVSRELRLRLLEDEASVKMEALSES